VRFAFSATHATAQFNRYVYDHLGNVTERHDDNMNVHETFTLDALSRLTQMTMSGTTAQTKTYSYDAIGNLRYKSDLGTLDYPAIGSPRPHAVTSITGNATGVLDGVTNGTYVYDANGNMAYSVQVNRIYTYTSFNLPSRIFNSNSTSDFIYDADHNRISESYVNGTIIYVNPGNVTFFERHKNFNQAGYEIYRFFVHTPSGATIFFSRQSNNGAQAVRFQLKDNLGSTVADVDATGNIVTRYSFDAFGKVRNPNGSATGGTLSQSRRGFTGHEHISVGNSGLIHMNGRVYDATLGRFITADPFIQSPSFSQSYNRYTYGFNNPLSGTDPSGFGFDIAGDFFSALDDFVRNPFKIENLFALNHNIPGHGTIDHFMMTHEWARVAGRAAATFFAGWFGPWAAAGANAMITGYEVWLAGGSSQDIHKAAAISFATSMAFNFVGNGAAAIAKGGNVGGAIAFKIVGHAAVGCASASASGGECGPGALSAGIGSRHCWNKRYSSSRSICAHRCCRRYWGRVGRGEIRERSNDCRDGVFD
jgi:RHS repeat-associated protein